MNDYSNISTLLNGCIRNDRKYQKRMYFLLRDFATKLCYRYSAADENPEEIIVDGFARLFKEIQLLSTNMNLHDISGLKERFKDILINIFIEKYRQCPGRILNGFENLSSGNIQINEMSGHVSFVYKKTIDAIRTLPTASRFVFNLFVIDGYSLHQISFKLNLSVDKCKRSLESAREALRKFLLPLYEKRYLTFEN